jgi:hypothetical protein
MRLFDKHFACEKNLRRLEREAKRLWQVRRDTPLVPLEQPYQRGWFKTYVLDSRIAHRADAPMFHEMLRAVNQRVYSRNREFRSARGFPIVLGTRRISLHRWAKLAWPASHQRFFRLGCWRIDDEEFRQSQPRLRAWRRGYKLEIDWWLREDIEPAMITHQRVALPEVETRLAEIESALRRVCGWDRLHRLHGRSWRWFEKAYISSSVELRANQSFTEQLDSVTPD